MLLPPPLPLLLLPAAAAAAAVDAAAAAAAAAAAGDESPGTCAQVSVPYATITYACIQCTTQKPLRIKSVGHHSRGKHEHCSC